MKVFRTILILVLVLALLGGGIWYFFIYRSGLPAHLYARYADFCHESANYEGSSKYYLRAYDLDPSAGYALSAAKAFEADGNYTKAEYSLVRAISDIPDSVELYMALSALYVKQDKLLDAERLLSNCSNEAIRQTLAALRPAAPVIQPGGGFSMEPTAFSLSYADGVAYCSVTREFPSTKDTPYSSPVDLSYGVTDVTALVVGTNGLVSPLATATFTVCGEITEVEFENDAFEELIRTMLKKSRHADIDSSELWAITELTVPKEVTELSDLSHFVGLESLSLEDNLATDFSVIQGMTRLSSLNVSGCALSEEALAAIGSLSTLTELHIDGCGITSLDGIAPLTNLNVLTASGNRLTDISALAGMPALTVLDISNNELTAISALAASTQLQELYLSGNKLSNLGAISANSALTVLEASGCGLTDLSPLENNTALVTLDVSDNALVSLDGIKNCSTLKSLNVSGNGLTKLDSVPGLTSLEQLDASSNLLTACPMFRAGSSLITLDLSDNQLENVKGLEGLESLNYLCISDNRVRDASSLADLPALYQIDALRNPLEDVSALEERSVIINYDPDYQLPDEEREETEEAAG
ncbi:MAG: leucine-rich repeat domain-containing protein [Oscillospiraceae bacterium]|nr:leucine-rich repeat domain-containing protein [Oscillospiraceae bacterium]